MTAAAVVGRPPEGGLHITLDRVLSAAVRGEAARRGLHPATLVAATMSMALKDNMLDAIFDGADPQEVAGGRGLNAMGLTYYQCAVLYLAAGHRDSAGVCRYSPAKFSQLIPGATATGVQGVLAVLIRRGLLARAQKEFTGGVQPHRVTAAGLDIAMQLRGAADADF